MYTLPTEKDGTMHQPSFNDIEYNLRKRTTRCEEFLRAMDVTCLIAKRFFEYGKVVYKGLAKNTHRLYVLFTSANLLMCIRAGRPLPA